MDTPSPSIRESNFPNINPRFLDGIAIAIAVYYFIVFYISNIPMHHDTQYHLAVTRMFYDAGGIVFWDKLQFQPVGRPHLYPPLTHAILSILLFLFNGDILSVGRLATAVLWPLLLLSIWFTGRQLNNSQTGLLAMIVASSLGGMLNLATMIMPTTLCLVLLNLLLITYVKQQSNRTMILLSILLFTSICYSHIAFPFIAALGLGFYAGVNFLKTKDVTWIKDYIIVIGSSLVLYSPWLIHILTNLSVFNSGEFHIDFLIDISIAPILVILALPALLGIIHKTLTSSDYQKHLIFIAPLIGLSIMTTYGHRFWPYFMFYCSFLTALTLTKLPSYITLLAEKIRGTSISKQQVKIIASIILTLVIVPSMTIYPSFEQGFVLSAPYYSAIPKESWINPTPFLISLDFLVKGFEHQVTPPELLNTSRWLSAHLERDEVIHLININSLEACTLIFLTGNPVTSGQWAETVTPEMQNRLQNYIKSASGFFVVRGAENVPLGAIIRETFANELIIAYRP